MQTELKPREVRCVPMGDQKILLVDWGDRKVIRYYYPTGYGNYYFDEIEYNGEVFIARSGIADDVRLERGRVKWERIYKPVEYNSAIMKFEKAYREPWWNTFRDVWHAVTSLCPVTIPP
jgi:hypothetical protein